MPGKLTRRMTATDAAFLYLERPHAPLHIGSLGVYKGDIPYERFVNHINSRMPLIPRYRQQASFVPMNLAHPTWEDDPGFDIRNHIFEVTLPSPGTQQQLLEVSTELFAGMLDRNKPLWEMYVIHGLEGGNSGILSKVHHCMVDGVSGIELLLAVVDITPEPAPPPEPTPWEPAPLPVPARGVSDALWDNFQQQVDMAREMAQGALDPLGTVRRGQQTMNAARTALPWLFRPAPATPFQVRLTADRHIAVSEVSFPEIREIRTSLGGTVNDVVLAVLAGALRRYMLKRGYGVDGVELRVAVPVNVRMEDEKQSLGNRISAMLPTLPLGEADPVARLRLIRDQVTFLKTENQASAFEQLLRMVDYIPVPVQALGAASNLIVNLVCTNVPGPMIPLYSVGHLLLAHYPFVPLSMNLGLGVGVTSYNQKLYFGLMADPHAVPDIDVLRQFVDESFLELRRAAGVGPSDLPVINGHAPKHLGAIPAVTAETPR